MRDLHRLTRLYMPRTYDELVRNYHVIVFSEANVQAVGPHTEQLARGVAEGGLGMQMSGGWQSFGASARYQGWGNTSIGGLLPTGKHLVVEDPQNELMRSIWWDTRDPALNGPVWVHDLLVVKPGADLLAPRGLRRRKGGSADGHLASTQRPEDLFVCQRGGWRLYSMSR